MVMLFNGLVAGKWPLKLTGDIKITFHATPNKVKNTHVLMSTGSNKRKLAFNN